ncbi:MAG: hypothetical protein A2513_04405 [Sulfurimonas sp. RIFOXYD12_FULL_33_39]|uniref:hypothetical protein n=1 Tax=unclassified Sulfurimonas TaxID=2623549 RepID=UPI0008AB4D34|nr:MULTISPECIES: hypothetical protein [unclassified Sulfurimonas]OHE09376.1 MAG: hypothetical protein A2513_04405 [Sulfurimonas sp. RIFOXYD12_FULL_33_39]OHE12842.1 MAG: hypothetical protein A2530_04400 [Sulfurimonas sp. RIFOXYD2_FULL_34_21]DAB27339.1 MAG TPA: hypothetical protein CFH78_08415 [Sulfurimonas sp. UBA10385]
MIQNKIYSIIGHKGYGKTKLTELLILLNKKPCIIADPRYQYEPKEYRRHFKNVGHFRKYILNSGNRKEFYRCKLQLVVNGLDEESFEELAALVYKMKKISFLVDEIDMFAPPTMTRKASFYQIIHYGRHNEIDIFTTSRRSANISRNLTSQTDVVFFSRVREPNDKKYIAQYIGKEYVQTAENLQKFHFLMIDEDFKPHILGVSSRVAHVL